ncbi:MAG: hypothetical protein QNL62_07660 [Gammaproteobacteria bacterium]|nr:hypothetical protein [Gammaproteobacteria bacterium]
MAKNKYNIKTDSIELTFQYISQYLHDQKWWKNEKQRLKAIKVYKKLKLEELYNIAKQDNGKYKSNFQASINDWCKRCINDKQWKKLKNSINQAKLQAETKESNQEKTISLSNKAYELLHNAARQKKSSISDLIIPLLEHKIENLPVETDENKPVQIIEAIKNIELNKKKLKTYEKVTKGKQKVIELWHYAGGQCQALSKTTHKRCKRITPELSIKHQIIGDIDYEFAVCHTHNNDTSQLDQSDINIKS